MTWLFGWSEAGGVKGEEGLESLGVGAGGVEGLGGGGVAEAVGKIGNGIKGQAADPKSANSGMRGLTRVRRWRMDCT